MNYKPLDSAIAKYPQTHADIVPGGLTFTIDFHGPDDKGHVPRTRTATCHLDHDSATRYVHSERPTYDVWFDAWFDGGGDQYGEDGKEKAIVGYVSIEEQEA